jgi:hypothetical protein
MFYTKIKSRDYICGTKFRGTTSPEQVAQVAPESLAQVAPE